MALKPPILVAPGRFGDGSVWASSPSGKAIHRKELADGSQAPIPHPSGPTPCQELVPGTFQEPALPVLSCCVYCDVSYRDPWLALLSWVNSQAFSSSSVIALIQHVSVFLLHKNKDPFKGRSWLNCWKEGWDVSRWPCCFLSLALTCRDLLIANSQTFCIGISINHGRVFIL